MRVTHLPTGLRAESHAERSQHRNYGNALRLLRGMVWMRGQSTTSELDLVRSYSLYPYRFVLDQRDGTERHDVEAVLDGDLDDFLRAGLGAAVLPLARATPSAY